MLEIEIVLGGHSWTIECVHCPDTASGDIFSFNHDISSYDELNDESYFLIPGDSLHLAKWSPNGWELEKLLDMSIGNCEIKLINESGVNLN